MYSSLSALRGFIGREALPPSRTVEWTSCRVHQRPEVVSKSPRPALQKPRLETGLVVGAALKPDRRAVPARNLAARPCEPPIPSPGPALSRETAPRRRRGPRLAGHPGRANDCRSAPRASPPGVRIPTRLSGSAPDSETQALEVGWRRTSRNMPTASGSANCSPEKPATKRPPRISPRASSLR